MLSTTKIHRINMKFATLQNQKPVGQILAMKVNRAYNIYYDIFKTLLKPRYKDTFLVWRFVWMWFVKYLNILYTAKPLLSFLWFVFVCLKYTYIPNVKSITKFEAYLVINTIILQIRPAMPVYPHRRWQPTMPSWTTHKSLY